MLLPSLILRSHRHSESRVDILNLLTVEGPVHSRFLHVQNLTSKWQNSLDVTVTALLGGTACGISLDQEKLTLFRIAFSTVCQFSRHSRTAHHAFSLHHFTGLAGCVASRRRQHYLFDYNLGQFRILLQENIHSRCRGLGHCGSYLRITKFGLGLALELRFSHLHGNDCGQTLTEILRCQRVLEFGEHIVLLGILLQRTGQAHLETLKMSTTLYGVNVIHIGIYLLRITVVILQGYVYRNNLI